MPKTQRLFVESSKSAFIPMIVSIALFSFVALILYRQIYISFVSNPGLNGLLLIISLFAVVRIFGTALFARSSRRILLGQKHIDRLNKVSALTLPVAMLSDEFSRISHRSDVDILTALGAMRTRLQFDRSNSSYSIGIILIFGLIGSLWQASFFGGPLIRDTLPQLGVEIAATPLFALSSIALILVLEAILNSSTRAFYLEIESRCLQILDRNLASANPSKGSDDQPNINVLEIEVAALKELLKNERAEFLTLKEERDRWRSESQSLDSVKHRVQTLKHEIESLRKQDVSRAGLVAAPVAGVPDGNVSARSSGSTVDPKVAGADNQPGTKGSSG